MFNFPIFSSKLIINDQFPDLNPLKIINFNFTNINFHYPKFNYEIKNNPYFRSFNFALMLNSIFPYYLNISNPPFLKFYILIQFYLNFPAFYFHSILYSNFLLYYYLSIVNNQFRTSYFLLKINLLFPQYYYL